MSGVLVLGSGVVGGALGWVAGWAGLWGVPPTFVWVVGFSPQIPEHPTSICDTIISVLIPVFPIIWQSSLAKQSGTSFFKLFIKPGQSFVGDKRTDFITRKPVPCSFQNNGVGSYLL